MKMKYYIPNNPRGKQCDDYRVRVHRGVLRITVFLVILVAVFTSLIRNHQKNLSIQSIISSRPGTATQPNMRVYKTIVVYNSPPVPHVPEKMSRKESKVVSSSPNSETIRYFTKDSMNIKYLTMKINGIPIDAMLDTGASFVTLNAETVQKLQQAGVIKGYKQKAQASTANGMTEAYIVDIPSIKIGAMEVTDVECEYAPYTKDNLLGGTFLSNFNYSINEDEQIITLSRKTALNDNPVTYKSQDEPPPNTAGKDVMTFNVRNICVRDSNINLKFYDETASLVWPSASAAWVLNAGNEYTLPISCKVGNKICFGGSQGSSSWGVGPNNSQSCAACCYVCANNTKIALNLTCPN